MFLTLVMFVISAVAAIWAARMIVGGASHADIGVIALAVVTFCAGVLGCAALFDLFEGSELRRRLMLKREQARITRSHEQYMIGSRED